MRRVIRVRGAKANSDEVDRRFKEKTKNVGQMTAIVARGMVEALEFDSNFEKLVEAVMASEGLEGRGGWSRGKSIAAKALAKAIGPALKRVR